MLTVRLYPRLVYPPRRNPSSQSKAGAQCRGFLAVWFNGDELVLELSALWCWTRQHPRRPASDRTTTQRCSCPGVLLVGGRRSSYWEWDALLARRRMWTPMCSGVRDGSCEL